MAKKPKRKRLVRDRDWHAWANKFPVNEGDPESKWVYCYVTESERPPGKAPNGGKWVRVKFVEAK